MRWQGEQGGDSVLSLSINWGRNETRWRLFKFRLLPTGLDFVVVLVNAVRPKHFPRDCSLCTKMLFNQHATDSTGDIGSRPCVIIFWPGRKFLTNPLRRHHQMRFLDRRGQRPGRQRTLSFVLLSLSRSSRRLCCQR